MATTTPEEYPGKHRRPEGTHQGTRLKPWQRPDHPTTGQPDPYQPRHAAEED